MHCKASSSLIVEAEAESQDGNTEAEAEAAAVLATGIENETMLEEVEVDGFGTPQKKTKVWCTPAQGTVTSLAPSEVDQTVQKR